MEKREHITFRFVCWLAHGLYPLLPDENIKKFILSIPIKLIILIALIYRERKGRGIDRKMEKINALKLIYSNIYLPIPLTL